MMATLCEGPLDLDYIERYWVTKAADCDCRSKTIIRSLIAELRKAQGLPMIEMSRPLGEEELAAFIRKYHEATSTTGLQRVVVVPPRMRVRARRRWYWPWRR